MVKHSQLVKEAANWLRSTMGYRLVVMELTCAHLYEVPDVMGWMGDGRSVLVECKTTLSDFRADKAKVHRLGEGLGQERWYYAPKGVIPLAELPEGWGLGERKEITDRFIVLKTKHPLPREFTPALIHNEKKLLITTAWRACEAASLVKPLMIADAPLMEESVA